MFSDIIDIIIDCTSCIQKVHTVTHNRWTPYFVIFNVVSYNWYAVVQAWLQSTDSIVEMFSVLLLFLVFHAATWCAYDRNAQENTFTDSENVVFMQMAGSKTKNNSSSVMESVLCRNTGM